MCWSVAALLATVSLADARPTDLGSRVCKQCHWDRFESYQNSSHSIAADPRTPAARLECETCHGSGGDHVRGGGGRGIGELLRFDAETPAEIKNAACLSCHERGKVTLWHGSAHDNRSLACTDCHGVHTGHQKLLKAPTQQEVCTRCHSQIRAALLKPSRHPIREQKLACSDCHNPHGTVTAGLIAATTVNDKCYECHAEKRGPFLWEHPPVRENCLNCHDPHGSAHEPLLVTKRPLLCQRCHSSASHPGRLQALTQSQVGTGSTVYQVGTPQTFYRSCQNCHMSLHGSNHPSGSFWHR